MSRSYISRALRDRVTLAARGRCGYCLTSEHIVGAPMEVDHLMPESLGGPTEEDNLWLACPRCNTYKADQVAGLDPVSGDVVSLFNPRHQVWSEHFAWTAEGDRIEGLPRGVLRPSCYNSIALSLYVLAAAGSRWAGIHLEIKLHRRARRSIDEELAMAWSVGYQLGAYPRSTPSPCRISPK